MPISIGQIVTVAPGVITAGGLSIALSGLALTSNMRIPQGSVAAFANAAAVGAYFGLASPEYSFAQVYFLSYDNSTAKPATLLMASYPFAAAAPAFLRGGNVGTLSLAAIQALTGTIALTVNGVLATSASINLAAASSFSNAASLIQAGFTTPPFTVTYDSVSGGFVFTATTTGPASTITPATGTLATSLLLTSAGGAVTSQGSAIATPSTFMSNLINLNQNWAAFTTIFEPLLADKLSFATWCNAQNNRFAYVVWDTDAQAAVYGSTMSAGYQITKISAFSGILPIYSPGGPLKAALALGYGASLDLGRLNGRTVLAFRSQSGMTPDVFDITTANNLISNGYSYYGNYGTPGQLSGLDNMFFNGAVSGPFLWYDSYINQISLNTNLVYAMYNLLRQVGSIPYNAQGYGLIDAAALDPITAALNFGTMRVGVPLSNVEAAEVNTSAGLKIDDILSQTGYYLQILPAAPTARAARTTPPMTLWYMDGESVQQINLASLQVQ